MDFRIIGFLSEADIFNLYSNLAMLISEEIIDQMTKTLSRLNDTSSSSVLELSLSTVLADYPHTFEYISLWSHFTYAVVKSWTKSISEGNWKNVRIEQLLYD